ncbi:MAG: dockerin type I repeat-containing protein, partial [Clostridia bacterium]|nr:dockerin type I repeat-containing protein [Clostridia bacterium]
RRLARIEAAVIATYFGLTIDYDMGDVDLNGQLNSVDYLLLKRAVMGTMDLTALQAKVADMDENGKLDSADYLLLKRKIFEQ